MQSFDIEHATPTRGSPTRKLALALLGLAACTYLSALGASVWVGVLREASQYAQHCLKLSEFHLVLRYSALCRIQRSQKPMDSNSRVADQKLLGISHGV